MKKVKIMLMSLALLAVVGGALAFKAKTIGNKFCTTNAQLVSGQYTCIVDNVTKRCPTMIFDSKTVVDGAFCTTTPLVVEIGGEITTTCINPDNSQALTCLTTTYGLVVE